MKGVLKKKNKKDNRREHAGRGSHMEKKKGKKQREREALRD